MKTSLFPAIAATTTAIALNAQPASARVLEDLVLSSHSQHTPSYNMQCPNTTPILLGAALISLGVFAGMRLKGLLMKSAEQLPVSTLDLSQPSSSNGAGFVTQVKRRLAAALPKAAAAPADDTPV